MSLIKEYIELTKKFTEEYGEYTIILMQNGAFFEVYGLKNGHNIIGCKLTDFSKICDLNIVDKKIPGGDIMLVDGYPVVNAGFKTHLIEKYVKKLQDNGYTIIIYEETGDDPIKKSKIRTQTDIFSPGTYLNDSSESEKITNNICCLWIEHKKTKKGNNVYIGLGLIDIYTGQTHVNEFSNEYIKNPTTFDDLEWVISIYNPSETIIVSNLPKNDVQDIVSFINLKSKSLHLVSLNDSETKNSIRAANCEKQTYQTELLKKFYQFSDINTFMSHFYENVYASQAFCYLLDFTYQHNPYLIKNISEPVFENASKKLILANHSLKQLHIIGNNDEDYKGKYSSVVKMLNECITPMGKRAFTHNFLNPVTDETYLQEEYDIVEKLLSKNNDYDIITDLLVYIKDICKIMRQIILQKVSPKSIYQLYTTINTSKNIYNLVIANADIKEYLNKRMPEFVSLLSKSTELITYLESVFIIEDCKDIDNISKIENSFIKNGVNQELDDKIKMLMDSQDQLEACRSYFSTLLLNNESNKPKSKAKSKAKTIAIDETEDVKCYVKIHETDKNNFSLVATDKRCKTLEELLKGHKSVGLKYYSSYLGIETGFTLFLDLEFNRQTSSNKSISSVQINSLCKNIGSIKVDLINVVSKVYTNIVDNLQNYQHQIDMVSEFITNVDLIYCKTFIASKYNYCKPTIVSSEKSFVKATELRHCLIEKIQQSELYVANDIHIGKDLDGILLYGTNAVGKTSLIRSLGISVIMAQAGLYVPASSYHYKPYRYIFTRILGNDNIFKGLSTFEVEMLELRTILCNADKNSLVLGDELCSGTESISAVSIFVAGIQQLASVGCTFIFATHLHEIIDYNEITSLHNVGMKHMSVVYNKEKDCLVYDRKLKDGPGNNMYGLEVCKSLKLPDSFLENAHNIRMKYNPKSSSILDQKQSHYNAKHVQGGICERCNTNMAIDVHHLIYQNEATNDGTISKKGLIFNKNSKANLINLCEQCHDEIHRTNKKYKKTKTTAGIILQEIS
jgi:DNA mismatch repair protein MutS